MVRTPNGLARCDWYAPQRSIATIESRIERGDKIETERQSSIYSPHEPRSRPVVGHLIRYQALCS
jgi:hypothetical protein